MSNRRTIKAKIDFQPNPEVRQILEAKLEKNPGINLSEAIMQDILIAAKPEFRRAYRIALTAAIKKLQTELRNLDAE